VRSIIIFLEPKKGFISGPFCRKILFPYSEPKWHSTEIKLRAFPSVFYEESDGDLFLALKCPKSPLKKRFLFLHIRDR
jgi:hypothetical protein